MFSIENREIDCFNPPYIIAELSANHNGSIARAKQTIKAAKDSGAHAIKIQTYSADTMTIDCAKDDFIVKGGLWNGYSLYSLYKEASTPFEWHSELFSFARSVGITIFSSPFDESAVALLESLNAPAYKIASFELADLPLIDCVARTGKPMFISTGMGTQEEIGEAVEVARTAGCKSLLLFHCISSYPAPLDQANLIQMKVIQKEFNVQVGLSDHTLGNTAALVATALGACAIEKHFTLDRKEKGPDSEFSMEPRELKMLVQGTQEAWTSLGVSGFSRPQAELGSNIFRRSIYFVADLKAGELITQNSIKRIRPGFGLPPKYFDFLIGKKVKHDVSRGDAVNWGSIE